MPMLHNLGAHPNFMSPCQSIECSLPNVPETLLYSNLHCGARGIFFRDLDMPKPE